MLQIDDGDDLEEVDDSNFVSSSNADLETEDDVTREDGCWRAELDEQEEPSNLRSKVNKYSLGCQVKRSLKLLQCPAPS